MEATQAIEGFVTESEEEDDAGQLGEVRASVPLSSILSWDVNLSIFLFFYHDGF